MSLKFADPESPSRPLVLVTPATLAEWLATQTAPVATWVSDCGFAGAEGELCLLPDASGACVGAVFGLGPDAARQRSRFVVAQAASRLPVGAWHIATPLDPRDADEACLAWLLAGYGFTRYAGTSRETAQLVCPEGVDAARLEALAAGEALTRDLINTPASDMGPGELEQAARDLAADFQADFNCVVGDDLLAANFPMVHAVGRASSRAPRLIDMRWGQSGPRVTLVGKGVIFDTGGLDIKPAASMGLMKKDMGGAATVLGLARMIMALNLPVRLRVVIPAVENAIAGNAFRPQDILTSRKGLTVEINNTDAEGRLVLADALTFAGEENPDLLVSMATLTGAARVAVGPDLAPFFTDDTGLAQALLRAGDLVRDPVWQLPFHAPYEPMIEPGIADLDNAPKGGFAGAITAALFLRRFVPEGQRYAHFDIYGWQPVAAPARPKGGVGQGARALLEALPTALELPQL
ncbi:M17 family metallopeptidase [Pseudoruegeria sp. SK021]|uniref:leucyl aminopeptidase family protein n=1 Tax=Pseudoruegeria sp. SK021 TaxID=1933035 RepID=UPI000A2371B6|nr:leucyl aminopeptidase family protein [Pseudoruegeria sp. SK021]OSP56794.1 leucyl aminopeptidase [Pseudoruegeria sp. SK021]